MTNAGCTNGEKQVSHAACAHAPKRSCTGPYPLQTQGMLCMLLQSSQGQPSRRLLSLGREV